MKKNLPKALGMRPLIALFSQYSRVSFQIHCHGCSSPRGCPGLTNQLPAQHQHLPTGRANSGPQVVAAATWRCPPRPTTTTTAPGKSTHDRFTSTIGKPLVPSTHILHFSHTQLSLQGANTRRVIGLILFFRFRHRDR